MDNKNHWNIAHISGANDLNTIANMYTCTQAGRDNIERKQHTAPTWSLAGEDPAVSSSPSHAADSISRNLTNMKTNKGIRQIHKIKK